MKIRNLKLTSNSFRPRLKSSKNNSLLKCILARSTPDIPEDSVITGWIRRHLKNWIIFFLIVLTSMNGLHGSVNSLLYSYIHRRNTDKTKVSNFLLVINIARSTSPIQQTSLEVPRGTPVTSH